MAIHVALDGNDDWSGLPAEANAARTDGPKATPAAALGAARKAETPAPKCIVLRGGDYFIEEPLRLSNQDSGLTVEAAPGEAVVLYGGRRVTGWRPDGDRFWAADLPEVKSGEWDFRMLVVNGRFCERARLPKAGFFTHLSEWDVRWMGTTGGGWQRKPTEDELTTMKYRPEDLGPWLDTKNAEVNVYHMWDESVVGVASIDTEQRVLKFASLAGHPPGAFGVKNYVVWNVREGLQEPGQWYLDRTAGKVVYWPLPGEDMRGADAVAPVAESIIIVQGSESQAVAGVTLRGLTLSVTNTPLAAGGFGAGRFPGAVSLVNTQDCRLLGLKLVNVGGQGVKTWRCEGLQIGNCEVHHTGACGLVVRGTNCSVEDCLVHDVGVSYPSAIGITCGGKGNRIAHSEIHDTPYSAVTAGGDDHAIEDNLIYRAMLELHDGAGIYIGFCKNVALRRNFVRDIVDTGGYGASAYYLDEQAENCIVENNLSLRVVRPSQNHWATNNTIRNNVFVADGDMNLTFARCTNYRIERNVVRAGGKITFSNAQAITAMPDNLLYSAQGLIERTDLDNYRQVAKSAYEPSEGTVVAEPGLEGVETGRCRFAAESPAHALGIEPVDVSAAGRRPG